jgi:hypothetical protein
MPACVLCGINMTVTEQTGHRTSSTGAYHTQCAYHAYMLSECSKSPIPDNCKQVQRAVDKLVHKRSGTSDEYP